MNDRTRMSFERESSISGRRPNKAASAILALRTSLKALGHFWSSLQLPHKIDRRPSLRQPHSITSDISPVGLPVDPSRLVLVLGRSSPNSRNSADRWPRHRWDTGSPIRGAMKASNSVAVIREGVQGQFHRTLHPLLHEIPHGRMRKPGGQIEQPVEGCLGVSPAVPTESELVEIAPQVLFSHAMQSTDEPTLQV